MNNTEPNRKQIVIHIGPHKTGSTAIQKFLAENVDNFILSGINFMHDQLTHEAALLLSQNKFEKAEEKLKKIGQKISEESGKVFILSQEDFCGDLPGRSPRRVIYPTLNKNLRIIARALRPHKVKFIFFVREEESWLASCYYQCLKHRTAFSSMADFKSHFEGDFLWEEKLVSTREAFGDRLITRPYSRNLDAGVQEILKTCGYSDFPLARQVSKANPSPSKEEVRLFERINALSSFKPTAWFAKSLVAQDWEPRDPLPQRSTSKVIPDLANIAVPDLTRRAINRIRPQAAADLLPPSDVDLLPYAFDILPTDTPLPSFSREDIRNQSSILDYHMRGKSKLAKLNALTISYLRRNTEHTEKARLLFHRIWREFGPLLINELTTRWLISTLQTFLDHGENESQRLIGAGGYFYANMMKIYEGERAIEGREQDATYEGASPLTRNKFAGMDRYQVGGTDLLLNTNALALDLAMRDDVAGLVLIEFLLRVKGSANVFTRMDRTRKKKEIEVAGFQDTWSFFEPR